MRAAWCADLYERKFLLIGRIFLQHTLNGQKTLQDALGIVHAIHAYSQQEGFDARFLK